MVEARRRPRRGRAHRRLRRQRDKLARPRAAGAECVHGHHPGAARDSAQPEQPSRAGAGCAAAPGRVPRRPRRGDAGASGRAQRHRGPGKSWSASAGGGRGAATAGRSAATLGAAGEEGPTRPGRDGMDALLADHAAPGRRRRSGPRGEAPAGGRRARTSAHLRPDADHPAQGPGTLFRSAPATGRARGRGRPRGWP